MKNYESVSDEELVETIRSHDKNLFVHILNRYQKKLMRYVRYLIHDDDKTADIVQQSFIKAFINLHGFDTKKKFSSWIYRITHNEALNAVKKSKNEVRLSPEFDVPSNQDLEIEFDTKEIINQAHGCLDLMPVLYSEPLALHFLDDKSYEEISDILHIPMGTVATRINRAKLLMKTICQKQNIR